MEDTTFISPEFEVLEENGPELPSIGNDAVKNPSRPVEMKKQLYLEQIRRGVGHTAACRAAHVSRDTINKCIKYEESFAAEVAAAERMQVEQVENALFKKCVEGNVVAIIFYLTNRAPEKWADRRGKTPAESVPDMTIEQLHEELAARGLKAAA